MAYCMHARGLFHVYRENNLKVLCSIFSLWDSTGKAGRRSPYKTKIFLNPLFKTCRNSGLQLPVKTDALDLLHILLEEKQGSYEVVSEGLCVVTNIRQHGTFKATGWVPKASQERWKYSNWFKRDSGGWQVVFKLVLQDFASLLCHVRKENYS